MPEIDALLINPVSARMIPAFVPHGLLYIAAYAIKCGHKIAIYDRNVEADNLEHFLDKFRPRAVGMGCLTGTAIDDAVAVSRRIRSFDHSIKIVWGGIHTTLYPDSVLKNVFVDFVVVGDGEKAFTGLLDVIAGKNDSIESIDNIGYKDNLQMKYTRRSFLNPDELPQPAWHLIKVENYLRKKFYADRVITINTSRGCPYKCSFCCVPRVHTGKWRGVSAEKIVENLRYLIENHKIDAFQVDDDEFDIDRARVLKLCELLRINRLNLKWSHFSRINIVKEEVLKTEKDSGLQLVEFGVESGSPRMLHFLNKGQTVEQITSVYGMCKKLKIRTSALFMIGLPTESMNDLMSTIRLIKSINPYISLCTIYRPYPGTELFDYCLENKLFSYDDNLEKVGAIYAQTNNTSEIDIKLLLRVKGYFDRRNILKEIKYIITRLKVGLFIYYVRYYVLKMRRNGENV